MVTIYLAGPIRDYYHQDIEWREKLTARLCAAASSWDVRILNPLGGKTFNPQTQLWSMATTVINPKGLFKQDLWSIHEANIVVANLLALAEGYPSIGTLMEVGAAAAQHKLIYTILAPGWEGPKNAMFGLHPFLQEASTEVFPSVQTCGDFLEKHIGVLTGTTPYFGGIVHD